MISAKVVADSICPRGNRLTTLELVMPRYILAEYNTHRVKTRNSASSRAIRLSKMVSAVLINPFIPYAWQEDHAGMQGTKYLNGEHLFALDNFVEKAKDFFKSEDDEEAGELQLIFMNLLDKPEYKGEKTLKEWWLLARDKAVECASLLNIFGLSKQICNRLLEPFMWHKVLGSATEWDNFFELRCPSYQLPNKQETFKSWKELTNYYEELHHDFWTGLNLEEYTLLERLQCNKGQADIHMMFLAEAIYDAKNESTPKQLKEREWHIPYGDDFDESKIFKIEKGEEGQTLAWKPLKGVDSGAEEFYEEAKRKISIVRCARVSYHIAGQEQVIDYAKDLELYDRLASSGHWSPFEHVARVMSDKEYYSSISGIIDFQSSTPQDDVKDGSFGWCRNYRGFIQQRALMD